MQVRTYDIYIDDDREMDIDEQYDITYNAQEAHDERRRRQTDHGLLRTLLGLCGFCSKPLVNGDCPNCDLPF